MAGLRASSLVSQTLPGLLDGMKYQLAPSRRACSSGFAAGTE